ncbi:lipid II flippase MurJ, partial [Streptomyces sp. URMC 123]|uniref:lipid II flippase MurJ n=1 Tax=Streptomyces sp. URMC 123 TaxID=3423403 RepID=UPI003F1D1AF0
MSETAPTASGAEHTDQADHADHADHRDRTARPTRAARPARTEPPARTAADPFVARAAAVTAVLTAAGALLGLGRDQMIAHLFGADGETDAFLVAWTVPEVAATLLIEDAMALVMIPAFSLALSRRAARGAGHPDPVRRLLVSTAPRLFVALACCAALLVVGAPLLVRGLAPGLADPELAITCTRLTAVTVLTFGVTGYLSAALRAHQRFVPPAAIYCAYNLGILTSVLVLHGLWGVRAAAVGVAVGSVLMVLVQLPAALRQLPARAPGPARAPAPAPAQAPARAWARAWAGA